MKLSSMMQRLRCEIYREPYVIRPSYLKSVDQSQWPAKYAIKVPLFNPTGETPPKTHDVNAHFTAAGQRMYTLCFENLMKTDGKSKRYRPSLENPYLYINPDKSRHAYLLKGLTDVGSLDASQVNQWKNNMKLPKLKDVLNPMVDAVDFTTTTIITDDAGSESQKRGPQTKEEKREKREKKKKDKAASKAKAGGKKIRAKK